MKKYIALSLPFLLVACANPLNQATSDNYADTCTRAEQQKRFDIAEEACYRAAVNNEWGNLGDDIKSERIYNLARIKRKVGKLDEAEKYFIETIRRENSITPLRDEQLGRRYAELCAVYYEQKNFPKAAPYLEKLLPIASRYSGSERQFVAHLFHFYAIELGDMPLAKNLKAASVELGYSES